MKRILFFNTTAAGYSPEQVERRRDTMTVGKLKEFLEGYDDNIIIMFKNDNGYTYGQFTEDLIEESKMEGEEEDEDEDEDED